MTERTRYPVGHVVHMSLDHTTDPSTSVARCDCGWECRVPWTHVVRDQQDAAIEAHWAQLEADGTAMEEEEHHGPTPKATRGRRR